MTSKRTLVVYEGDSFRIEWYYDANNKSQPKEYYENLGENDRIKALKLFKRMGDSGVIRDKTKYNNEGDKIYAFKPRPHRFLNFFQKGSRIIVTSAFMKKQDKLPANEKRRALEIREDYLNRVKEGIYYEKGEE